MNDSLVLLARQGIEELKWDNNFWLLEQQEVKIIKMYWSGREFTREQP